MEDYIDVHLDEDVTVADLATVACMSVGHFARAFKNTTGMTPNAFRSIARGA